jgi:ssDNA-binding Zn-finger/Zn-ribbon topoisomerase 1
MSAARLLLLLVGIGFLYYIIRQLIDHWLRPPEREREYREIDAEERAIMRETGDEIPECPLCGSMTRLHRYRHITVWRCVKYPECRGFVKARKPRRPKFAADWERKRKKERT